MTDRRITPRIHAGIHSLMEQGLTDAEIIAQTGLAEITIHKMRKFWEMERYGNGTRTPA